MYKFFRLTFWAVILFTNIVWGQKEIIDHTTYDEWNTIGATQFSQTGKFISYEVNPHRGDGNLYILNNKNEIIGTYPRGKKALFTQDETMAVFSISPGFDTLRTLELGKVKKEKWVKDSLQIVFLNTGTSQKIANVSKFSIAENGNVLAYTVLKDSVQLDDGKKTKKKKKKKNQGPEITSKGNVLFFMVGDQSINLNCDDLCYTKVTDFKWNKSGDVLYFITHEKQGKQENYFVNFFDVKTETAHRFDEKFKDLGASTFQEDGNLFALMASKDTSKEARLYSIYTWDLTTFEGKVLIEKKDNRFQDSTLTISPKSKLYFSKDNSRLFFGLYEIPQEPAKDTLLESEKAELDVWHYQDKRLQPQQLKDLKRDKERSLLTVYDFTKETLVTLESDTLKVSILDKGNANYALGSSNERYAASNNWNMPWPDDYYRVNLATGETELILENVGYSQGLNPTGKYFIYFDSPKNQYYSINLETNEKVAISIGESVNWKSDINGMPYDADPLGTIGYLSEKEVLLQSEFDLWVYNLETKTGHSLTHKMEENTKFKLIRTDRNDSTYINLLESYVVGTDQETFDESIYRFDSDLSLQNIYQTNHTISGIIKAKESDLVLFRQMNVSEFPNLHLTKFDFEKPVQISDANPQQAKYNWVTVEPVKWTAYNGEELRGLIYKPEDFDAEKSYPMIVYFYELYSHGIHRHYTPRPTASIVFPTEYASAGYVVFIPDIRYTPGHPGKDAYNSIMSGTDKVLALYPNIDSTRMGLQGQSWGGYQTAQLITLTDRYKAAMAGAPVSNMFSAYGGIRWGSGLNRQFQYEKTQSRIGGTIWEVPELYVENSPLFGVPNINTPLLIMHNDNDGAVPWYQGIELFTAMKRLDKPVWMLVYNNEEHNLMKDKNRRDLSIRMRQFFDYYLQGKPAPEWLEKGVPAIEKGKNYGLE